MAAAVLLVGFVVAPLAGATFLAAEGASHSVSTAALAPPTDPSTAAGNCDLLLGDEIVVSWTPSSSTWTEGYEVLRSTLLDGIYEVVGTVPGQASASYTDGPLLPLTTYYYVVRAYKGNWRSSGTAPVSRTTRSSLCV